MGSGDEETQAQKPKGSSLAKIILALCLGAAILIVAGGLTFQHVFVKPATDLPGQVLGAIGRLTGKKVELTGNSVILEKSEITELSVVQRKSQVIVKFQSEFLGSKNLLILRGDFVVKAGFDLSKPYTVKIDQESGAVTADFPPAEILSVEMRDYEIFHSEDGIVNRLKPEDQELAIKQMLNEAKLDANKSDIRDEAERVFQMRLNDLLDPIANELILEAPKITAPLP